MTQITYIEFDGKEHKVDVDNGDSVMRGATDNMIEGIVGECGGSCSCATCHCYVDEAWLDKLSPPSELEMDMLECVFAYKPNSRLSCQITVTDELDGLVVRLPEAQS